MYKAAGQGQITPGVKILMSTETSCHFNHLLQVSKNLFEVWYYTILFMILYMYIHVAPGQGLTTPRGRNFCQQEHLVTLVTCCKLKISLKSDFMHFFFHDFIHVYSPCFNVNRNVLSFHSFDANLKKMPLKSDFIQFVLWFNTCI